MRIGITGATGFVGRVLLRELITAGYQVRCLAHDIARLDSFKIDDMEVIYGDLQDSDALRKFVEGCDIIIHAAAIRGDRNIPYAAYQKINVEATLNLLKLSQNAKKFIFISTVGVIGYGNNLSENSPYQRTANKYHLSKIRAEEECFSFRNSVILRPAIVYGEGDSNGMVFKLCAAIKNKRFIMIGNGFNKIHMVNIHNLIMGIRIVMDKGLPGNKYIIADDYALEFREIAGIIAAGLNVKLPSFFLPKGFGLFAGLSLQKIHKYLALKGDPLFSYSGAEIASKEQVFDIEKIKKIGYNPRVYPREAVREFAGLFAYGYA